MSRAVARRGDGGTTPPCYEAKRKVWQTRSINSQPRHGAAARRGEARDQAKRGETSRGSACLDRDVATVWPSYALLPLLLSFSKPLSSLSLSIPLLLSLLSVLHRKPRLTPSLYTVYGVCYLRGEAERKQAPDERKFQPSFPLSLSPPSLSPPPSSALPFAARVARLRHGQVYKNISSRVTRRRLLLL